MSVWDGAQGIWKLNDDAGNGQWSDINTTTANHLLGLGTPAATTGHAGGTDDAVGLDTTSMFLFTTNVSQTNLDPTSNDFAISGWVRINSYPAAAAHMVSKWDGVISQQGYAFSYDSTGTLKLFLSSDGTDFFSFVTTADLALDTDYHVMAVYDHTDVRLYIDGDLASVPASHALDIFDNTAEFRLGALGSAGSNRVSGALDDFVLFHRAPSAAEVTELFSLGTDFDAGGEILFGAVSTTFSLEASFLGNGIFTGASSVGLSEEIEVLGTKVLLGDTSDSLSLVTSITPTAIFVGAVSMQGSLVAQVAGNGIFAGATSAVFSISMTSQPVATSIKFGGTSVVLSLEAQIIGTCVLIGEMSDSLSAIMTAEGTLLPGIFPEIIGSGKKLISEVISLGVGGSYLSSAYLIDTIKNLAGYTQSKSSDALLILNHSINSSFTSGVSDSVPVDSIGTSEQFTQTGLPGKYFRYAIAPVASATNVEVNIMGNIS